ncbi:hypothetical protein AB1N83_013599 [Pleurotus pulmonarius]
MGSFFYFEITLEAAVIHLPLYPVHPTPSPPDVPLSDLKRAGYRTVERRFPVFDTHERPRSELSTLWSDNHRRESINGLSPLASHHGVGAHRTVRISGNQGVSLISNGSCGCSRVSGRPWIRPRVVFVHQGKKTVLMELVESESFDDKLAVGTSRLANNTSPVHHYIEQDRA